MSRGIRIPMKQKSVRDTTKPTLVQRPPNYDTYKTANPKKKKPTKNCHTGDRIQTTAMLSFNDKWQEFVCLA